MKQMKVLLLGLGSAGDVHPNVALGVELKRRGHEVVLVAASVFRDLAAQAGLEFYGLGTDEEHYAIIRNPDLWHPMKAFSFVAEHIILEWMRPVYEFIGRNYEPGRTIVAAPGTAFGARIAQEKLGVPLATLHLQPSLLRSSLDPPCYTIPDIVKPMPVWLRKVYYRAIDWLEIDRLLLKGTNAFRRELGLPAVHRVFDGWLHSTQLVIGLFPYWFAPQPADWPAHFHHTGFPLWDEGDVRRPDPELEKFLSGSDAPYVFTAGSANMHGHRFFHVAVETCVASKRRGILIARYPGQIPSPLPEGVRHFEYIPFSQVLQRAAAFVHHGGIGTTAQSLVAGVPQLVMPLAHDQFDNALRVKRLGTGDFLLPRNFKAGAVAQMLQDLTGSPEIGANCRQRARDLADSRPLETTCALLEGLIRAVPGG
jgi:UDP:flavonoid glycosyltransferase YjiC (YdhE family)